MRGAPTTGGRCGVTRAEAVAGAQSPVRGGEPPEVILDGLSTPMGRRQISERP